MTLAGTRPPTVDEWDKYELHHRARLATKPGLTGMWQVSGRSKGFFYYQLHQLYEKISNILLKENKLNITLPDEKIEDVIISQYTYIVYAGYDVILSIRDA